MTEPRPYADAAQSYWRAGWANPIPVKGKWPPPEGYTGYDGRNVTWPDLQRWTAGEEAGHNIALRLPGDVVGIDVDAHDGRGGGEALTRAESELGALPPTVRSTARPPWHASGIRFYRVPAGASLRGAEKRFRATYGDGVDIIRRDHRYAVVWPSVHPETGTVYDWYDADGSLCSSEGAKRGRVPPRPTDLAELPAAWVEFLTSTAEEPAGHGAQGGGQEDHGHSQPNNPHGGSVWDTIPRAFTREEAIEFCRPHVEALRAAAPGTINNTLNEAAFVLGHFVPHILTRAEGLAWLDWGLAGTAYDGKTWKAESTIRSAWAAPKWRAELVEAGPEYRPGPASASLTDASPDVTPTDDRAAYILRRVATLHLEAEARDRFDAERHAARWTPPGGHGHLGEELALPEEPTRWRLAGLLGVGHNAVLVAGRKVGKTTMINQLVKAYADGEAFLGRFAVAPADASVAVWNYEVDAAQYRRWLREVGVVNPERVHVLHLRGRTAPLRDARVRAWAATWLRERGVGLWIVDPYSRAYVGSVDNGNDEAKVGAFLDCLDVIKAEAGVSELVMPVHSPKGTREAGEETAIGSQRLEAWPDSLWYLTRDLDTGLRFMRAEGRDVDVPEEQLTYDADARRLVLGGWDRRTLRSRAELEAVVTFVRDHPGCSQNDIQHGLGWGSPATAAKRVERAIGSGLIRRTEATKGRGYEHWTA